MCKAMLKTDSTAQHLFIECLVVFEQRLERLEYFNFTGHAP